MSVLINFKICDNAEECGGIEVCPTGALSWDDRNKTINIDNDKCTSCSLCEKACGVEAIKVAKTDEEYAKIKKEFDDDPRKIGDLIVDRYGAQPIFPESLIDESKFDLHVLKSARLTAVEFFNDDTIECMIKSIPIKDILVGHDYKYRKLRVESDDIMKKYDVSELPALLFFKDGKFLGKVEGYFQVDQKNEIRKIIKDIIG